MSASNRLLSALVGRRAARDESAQVERRGARERLAEMVHAMVWSGVEPDAERVERLAEEAAGDDGLDLVADYVARAGQALAVARAGQAQAERIPALEADVADAKAELVEVEDILCRALARQARKRGADRATQLAVAKEQLSANPQLAGQLLSAQRVLRDAEERLRRAHDAVRRGQQADTLGLASWWRSA